MKSFSFKTIAARRCLLPALLWAALASLSAAEPPLLTNAPSWTGSATNAKGEILATIVVDTSEVVDLKDWGRRAGELCVQWYPRLVDLLPGEGFRPKDKVRLSFKKDMKGVANASRGGEIRISANYVRGHTNDWGMVVHELTHIVQSYPRAEEGFVKPGWLVEGIADYIRLKHFEPEARRPRINPEKASYRDSYKTTAAFLEWIAKDHDKDWVRKANHALRHGKFTLELFKESTGQTVDELWPAFLATLPPRA